MYGTTIEKKSEAANMDTANAFLNPKSKNQCYTIYDFKKKLTLNLDLVP
jgi:hypothetical protein